MVEPVFEKINFNQREGEVEEQIKTECKTDVPSDSVAGVLAVSPWVTLNDSETGDGKVFYSGKIIFYIAYTDTDGNLKKCECGSEFKGEIKDASVKDGCRVSVSVRADKAEADVSGSCLSVGAFVTVTAEITECAEISALVGGENLVVKENEISCIKGSGVKRGAYPIEEEFELSYSVAEVLFHRADAVVTATQCGVGCIIVDGEVHLTAIMLQKNDKNDIIKENRLIPFRMEIECEDAMPSMQAVAKVREKSFKTDVAVDDETGKSTVSASVSLIFEGEAFLSGCMSVAADVFSTEAEIEVVRGEFPFYKMCDLRSFTAVVGGRAETGELPVGASVLAVGGEKITVVSYDCAGEGLNVTGVLSATCYLRDGDGRVFTRRLETPFEKLLEGVFDCASRFQIVVKAEKANAKIISLTETELEAEAYFTVYPFEKCDNKIVKEIRVLGEKKKNESAISVYIPSEGEELWTLAKRLNVCPESLIATNRDLQFPLTGKERIVIYRGK